MPDAERFFVECDIQRGFVDVVSTGDAGIEDLESAGMDETGFDIGDLGGADIRTASAGGVRRTLQERVREFGIDAIAFYRPFHVYGAGRWGIVFREDRIRELVASVGEIADVRDCGSVTEAVVRAVDQHELVHFRSEVAATHAEVITGIRTLYTNYLTTGWRRPLSAHGLIEEGLATVDELRRAARSSTQLGVALADLVRGLPGYGDFALYRTRTAREEAYRELLQALVGTVPSGALFTNPIARDLQRSVPRRWMADPSAPDGSVSPKSGAVPLAIVINDAKVRGAAVERGTKRRHPTTVRVGSRSVPIKNWGDRLVPGHVVRQLADLFGLEAGQYRRELSHRRKGPR